KAGAFDSLEPSRARLLEWVDDLLRWAERLEREASSDQMGLFGGVAAGTSMSEPPAMPQVADWSDKESLRAEKEAIGFFISGHPLDKFHRDLRRLATATTGELSSRANQETVTIGGVIHTVKNKNSKKGERYATFFLEDREGVVECIAWPDAYRKFEAIIHGDEPVLVSGSLDVGEERCQVIAAEFRVLADARQEAVKQVHLRVSAERITDECLQQLRDTLAQHRGNCPAFLDVIVPGQSEAIIELPPDLRVTPSEAMLDAVERLFGAGVAVLR
ncbi:MAG: OB-fold nucleic acid binding domain-containing protein, partial [Candidatus Binatia bacterium]